MNGAQTCRLFVLVFGVTTSPGGGLGLGKIGVGVGTMCSTGWAMFALFC